MATSAQQGFIVNSGTRQFVAFSDEEIEHIFDVVLRNSTEQPGFYYKDLGDQFDSKSLRRL